MGYFIAGLKKSWDVVVGTSPMYCYRIVHLFWYNWTYWLFSIKVYALSCNAKLHNLMIPLSINYVSQFCLNLTFFKYWKWTCIWQIAIVYFIRNMTVSIRGLCLIDLIDKIHFWNIFAEKFFHNKEQNIFLMKYIKMMTFWHKTGTTLFPRICIIYYIITSYLNQEKWINAIAAMSKTYVISKVQLSLQNLEAVENMKYFIIFVPNPKIWLLLDST